MNKRLITLINWPKIYVDIGGYKTISVGDSVAVYVKPLPDRSRTYEYTIESLSDSIVIWIGDGFTIPSINTLNKLKTLDYLTMVYMEDPTNSVLPKLLQAWEVTLKRRSILAGCKIRTRTISKTGKFLSSLKSFPAIIWLLSGDRLLNPPPNMIMECMESQYFNIELESVKKFFLGEIEHTASIVPNYKFLLHGILNSLNIEGIHKDVVVYDKIGIDEWLDTMDRFIRYSAYYPQ